MSLVLQLTIEFAVLLLWAFAFFFVLLEYRMTPHPKWLDNEYVVVPVVLILTTWMVLATGFLFRGLLDAGFGVIISLAGAIATLGAVYAALWTVLAMRRRLRDAEAGISPFHIGRQPGVAH